MFKKEYDKLNESIYPSQKVLERTKKQKTTKKAPILISAVTVCMLLGITFVWQKQKEGIQKSSMVNESKTIYYNDLVFPAGKPLSLPEILKQPSLDIVGFKESDIVNSNAVVKVTIKEATVVQEEVSQDWFIIYKATIDKVYHGNIKVREEISIKDNLHYYSPCLGDSVKIYIENRQYILALSFSDTTYHSFYPFGAQIEITKNNEYIFMVNKDHEYNWWSSLANNKSKKTKDCELLYYRNDLEFENDLQKVVDRYCQ